MASRRAERRRAAREARRAVERPPAERGPAGPPAAPPPAGAGALLGILVGTAAFALYALTACRTIFGGDSAELALAAATFGVAHPPGYALYTLASGAWVQLLPWGDPALGANLASALYAALALGLLAGLLLRLGTSRAAAAFGALALGLGATFWSQATVAEVYTFDLLLLFLTLHATLSAARATRPRGTRRPLGTGGTGRWLALGALAGSWLLHRPVNIAYLPAVGILYHSAGGSPPGRRQAATLAAGLVLGVAPVLYLPWASSRDPLLDIGDPESLARLWVVVSGGPYRRHLSLELDALAWGRVRGYFAGLPRELGLGCVLAALGIVAAWCRGRALACAWIAMAVAGLVFAALYNVLDVDVYFLPSFAALAILAALGVDALQSRAGPRGRGRLAPLWLAAGLVPLPLGFAARDLSGERFARLLAEDLLSSIDDDALLFLEGDTSIHAVWYLQGVEGAAPDVVVFSAGHAFPWYVEQLRERHPDADWPALASGRTAGAADDTAAFAREVLYRLGAERPAYHSFTVRPQELLAPRGDVRYASIPQGLTQRILRTGDEQSVSATCDRNAAFFARALERLGPIPERVGMEATSILLQYAIAAAESAKLLERAGRDAEARELWHAVLRFDFDRRWEEVRRDARRAGIELPRQDLEREALQRLGK